MSFEHDDQISDEGDWDADVGTGDAAASGMQVYTMQSVNGMVTITPSSKRKTQDPPVDVEVTWYHGGDEVLVYTSLDDFATPFPLGEETDEDGNVYHTGVMRLPPGKYLSRFLVDGDWCVDDDQQICFSLGYEYNQIVAGDAYSSSEDEDDDDDEDDWDDIDDQLPEFFNSGLDQTRNLFGNLAPTAGMVTISPDMFRQAMGKDDEPEPEATLRPGRRGHERQSSTLQWDSVHGKFVVAQKRRPSAAADDDAAAAAAGADGESKPESEMTKEERKKARRRAKRRRRRKKRRANKRRKASNKGGGGGASEAELQRMRDQIAQREREWREQWAMHESKLLEKLEQEKKALQLEHKEALGKALAATKEQQTAADALRAEKNALQTQVEELTAHKSIHEETSRSQGERVRAETERLQGELAKAKSDLTAQKEAARAARDEADKERSALSAKVDELDKAVEAAQRENTQLRSKVESLGRQVAEAQEESASAHSTLEQRKAEFERQLEAARAEMAASQAKDSESLKAALTERLDSTKEELAAATAARDEAQQKLLASGKELSSVRNELDAARAQVSELEARVASAEKAQGASSERVQAVTAELEAAKAAASERESAHDAAVAELEAQLAASREKVAALESELDAVKVASSEVQSKLANAEAAFGREREELERQLAVAKESHSNLAGKVVAVSRHSDGLRASLKALREQQIQAMNTMRHDIGDSQKFLVRMMARQEEALSETLMKYKKEMHERRKYFNLVQELRGNIRVFCRARPFIGRDTDNGAKEATSFGEEGQIKLSTDKRDKDYEFDKVFRPDSTQEQVFDECRFLVQSCMDGYNVCIFAYGQTGSGKTFTMQGPNSNPGVYMRALTELFRIREERVDDFDYTFKVSMLEIYNEQVKDLLTSEKEPPPLKIHRGQQGMYVENLTEWEVDGEEDILRAMDVGSSNRSVGHTDMNAHSSRSHSMLSVKVTGKNLTAGISYFGKLNMIDLAGSERVGKSGATGERLKEAQAINKSLSALGNVIEALQQKRGHVPYRDSKLTYLLQDSLGGHAKTLMFINISPADLDAEETFCSLNFADRVRRVELGAAVRNVGNKLKPPKGKKGSGARSVSAAPGAASKRGGRGRGRGRGSRGRSSRGRS